jgi:hypothetical protein
VSYPIGTPGVPWTRAERLAWRALQRPRRSYEVDVVSTLHALGEHLEVVRYGTLTVDQEYPLVGLRSRDWSPDKPTALITGGVHGYETSGVHGALRFARVAADERRFNLAIAPCVSPWAYEVVNRWNADAVDPNRSFVHNSPAQECRALMAWVATLGPIGVHLDLHETTDTDESEFRPAKAARDGEAHEPGEIPDGFYLVDRTDRPVPAFQAAVRDRVASVTHIAEADADGHIIGEPLQQHGVIEYDGAALGLCMCVTDAPFATTTEVYPDSPRSDPETCIQAQVAAVRGGLEFVAGVGRS